jgi:DNA primase
MDLLEFLDDIAIRYSTGGKNVAPGWIGLRCPFCDDESNHLGVRVNDLKCTCWKCGGHSLVNVITEIADISKKEARRVAKSLTGDETHVLALQDYDLQAYKRYATKLPPEAIKVFPTKHKQYLRGRGFHANRIIRKYNLLACQNVGNFKFRIVIPIYVKRSLVSFTSRAVYDGMEPKYKNAPLKDCIMSAKESIYNIDTVQKGSDCLVCEGPVDVWRFGDGAVAIIGIQFTQYQLSLLKQKEIRNLYIMLDSERYAQRVKAEQIARLMSPWVSHFELLEARYHKDLGEFTHRDAEQLRNILKFNHNI